MENRKRDNVIKTVIIAALVCVCVAAVIGIRAIIQNGKSFENEQVTDTLVAEPETTYEVDIDIEPQEIIVEDIKAETEDVTIEYSSSNETEQKLQDDPVIPEAPTEAPELAEGTDITDPDTVPECECENGDAENEESNESEETAEEQVTTIVPDATTQNDADSHPGEIYVIGFGWVPDVGPGEVKDVDVTLTGVHIGSM